MSSSRGDHGGRRDLGFTAALFVIALLPRLFVAIAWSKEPVWDGHYYHLRADRIAHGLGYSEDVLVGTSVVWKAWAHYPVGYSAFLAIFYKLFGSGLLVAPVLNALLGAVGVALAHRVARRAFSTNRARLGAGLLAVHPGLIAYSALVMTEILAGTLLLGALLVGLKWRARWQGALGYGALIGLCALVRPASLALVPLWFFFEQKPWKPAVGRALVTALACVVMVLPWTLRNCDKMDGCALISTNGGWNLAIGALTDTGRFVTLKGSDGCSKVTGQVQQDRCWGNVGLSRISASPAKWLALAPKKLEQTYNHESFAVEYLREADTRFWYEGRRVAARNLLTGFHRFLLVLAALSAITAAVRIRPPPWDGVVQFVLLLGIALFTAYASAHDSHPFYVLPALFPIYALLPFPGAPHRSTAEYWLLCLVLVTSLTHIVFFGEDRYHLVLSPVFCILAGGALRLRRRSNRPAEVQ